MTQANRRRCVQLVSEVLAEALRNARLQPPERDRSPQRMTRLSQQLRRGRRPAPPPAEIPESFLEYLQELQEDIEREQERERWRAAAEEARRKRDHTDRKQGGH